MKNIMTLLEALNPSRKVLVWVVTASVAAIPTVWVLSGKISAKRVMDNTRLTKLETSVMSIETKVDGLSIKFDDAEQRFKDTYETGVDEVGEIIKESDKQQTEQIKFLVDNWSEENRKLISNALELRQSDNESKINEMINEAKKTPSYKGEAQFIPLDDNNSEIYSLEDVKMPGVDSISKNFKILYVEMNSKGNYNMKYRDYTTSEKNEIEYFKNK